MKKPSLRLVPLVLCVLYLATSINLPAQSPVPAQFIPITPCRLVDTSAPGGGGPIPAGTYRTFSLPQLSQSNGCGDLSAATAFALNVTISPTQHNPVYYVTLWPTGEDLPVVSLMNSLDGRVKASAAIVPGGTDGAVNIYVTNEADFAIDVSGYFTTPAANTFAFFPLPPCRVVDTRRTDLPPGLGTPHLSAGVPRDFPVLSTSCIHRPNVQPAGYSATFTVVPYPALGNPVDSLEIWPTGHKPTTPVSTLSDFTGTYVANAAIVPAGDGSQITAQATQDTDLVIDINGYFATPRPGGQSFYPTTPCRVIDTRTIGNGQPFSGQLSPPVDVVDSACTPPSTAQAYVLNATVVPSGYLGYLTLWPDGLGMPVVSNLNAADGWITSNMAIVPTSNGSIDAYATNLTQLVLDISGYFAPIQGD